MTLQRLEPIFPVRDVTAAAAHYRALGFEVEAYEGPDHYAFASRDGVRFHLQQVTGRPRLRPRRNMFSTYLYCADADALYAEWSGSGAGGTDIAPSDTSYGLREGAHLDDDANLIRYGSPLEEAMP